MGYIAPEGVDPALWALTTLCGLTKREIAEKCGISAVELSRETLSKGTRDELRMALREISNELYKAQVRDPMLRRVNVTRSLLFDTITGDRRSFRS